ncbi:MAG TPA: PatA/PatG family cyanobactin maturation protease [Pirellulales bacterium]|nr:PatA/PatG family cyanobactin maturation protease [Pirellulales bacterium]
MTVTPFSLDASVFGGQPAVVYARDAALRTLWQETLGDPRITIAILDGPVDVSHSALAGANLTIVPTLASVQAGGGAALAHGTHIASLILGRQNSGAAGVAPNCRGLVVPIFRDGDDGRVLPCSQIDLARAITVAAEQGAHIINISGGEFSPSGAAYPLLTDVVDKYARRGILIVAAAGNDGCECLHIPAALSGTLAVGAMDAQNRPLASSNWGAKYRSNGLLAPGADLVGAKLGGGTIAASGSSVAAAFVSGVAGLLMSLELRAGRKPDGARMREVLLRSSDPCVDDAETCRRWLAGRLNMSRARAFLTTGMTTMTQDPFVSEGVTPQSAPTQSDAPARTDAAVGREPAAPSDGGITPSASVAMPVEAAGAVWPSACGCGTRTGGATSNRVFVIGQLGYDFGTEARRDSLDQYTDGAAMNPRHLLTYLEHHPAEAHLAQSIIWTLNFDQTPVYAIYPLGPFASEVYARLRGFLRDQTADDPQQRAESVSIAGVTAGSVRLLNGPSVPVIVPELRGMFNWRTDLLRDKALGPKPHAEPDLAAYSRAEAVLHNFLERVYHEQRNLGVTPEDRALNFAATNAFQASEAVKHAVKLGFELESFEVERSAHCRPESDCWDVKINFFDPAVAAHTVRRVCRFTVDVSDVVPVMVGPVRHWTVRIPAGR